MSTHQYQYNPLNVSTHEIRIVHILPGAWGEDIACELRTTSLDGAPIYQTLSYVWGDASITKPILVDGSRFEVTANLYAALKRLRCATTKRVIWIDALCINQRDNEEKTSQVMLMQRIYEGCAEVLIWLGDWDVDEPVDERTIEDTQDELEQFFQAVTFDEEAFSQFEPKRRDLMVAFAIVKTLESGGHIDERPWFRCKSTESRLFEGGSAALTKLMNVPYWNRIWVVQEMRLPQSAIVVCGSISMSWSVFTNANNNWNLHHDCCEDALIRGEDTVVGVLTEIMVTVMNVMDEQMDVFRTLLLHSHRQATDPRDKVYGLLSICRRRDDDIKGGRFVPDYTIPKELLFPKLTMQLIESTGCLKVLTGTYFHQGIPSWVADWSVSPSIMEVAREHTRLRQYDLYNAMVGDIGQAKYELSSLMTVKQVLRLAGKEVDTEQPYAGGGAWEDAYWRTLRVDITETIGGYLRRAEAEDKARHDFLFDIREGMEEEIQEMFFQRANIDDFGTIYNAVKDRRFFITQRGYLGFAPENTQIGDEVYVINGSKVPFVLRRLNKTYELESRTDESIIPDVPAFNLIGNCYVHGIMDGEAASGVDGKEAKDLILC
ncbi:uncharacterized protein PAC_16760 [Phialocephala subalpina]|uniref:Heterokaryon incompatibility domain-containing protein n=1 Tax=Phialocephala subalpina TaxID=576137 RepID=A0A1L7XPA1_9HELO|nr:uncharacterized protein PAC_16760 [Phialocephala subalpina]